MKGLVKKAVFIAIPPPLYERIQNFEGGKYTPKSVVLTAVEEWLDAREKPPAPAAAAEGTVQS